MLKRVFHFQLYSQIDEKLVEKVSTAIRKFTIYQPKLIAASISSQGGTIVQAMILTKILQNYAKQKDVPFYTFGDDQVLNSAMLVLAAGNKVYANPFTILGDSQHFHQSFGLKNLEKHFGIVKGQVVSQKYKDKMNQFRDLRDDEKEWINDVLKFRDQELLNQLVNYRKPYMQEQKVSEQMLEQNLNEYPLITSKQAKSFGLIDDIVRMEDLLKLRYHDVGIHQMLGEQDRTLMDNKFMDGFSI